MIARDRARERSDRISGALPTERTGPNITTMRMDPFERGRFGLLRLSWWQGALLGALAIAAVLAVAIVAASLLLILVPLVLIAVLAHRFLARRPGTGGGRPAPPAVIDAEYEVISERPPPDFGEEDRARSDSHFKH